MPAYSKNRKRAGELEHVTEVDQGRGEKRAEAFGERRNEGENNTETRGAQNQTQKGLSSEEKCDHVVREDRSKDGLGKNDNADERVTHTGDTVLSQ